MDRSPYTRDTLTHVSLDARRTACGRFVAYSLDVNVGTLTPEEARLRLSMSNRPCPDCDAAVQEPSWGERGPQTEAEYTDGDHLDIAVYPCDCGHVPHVGPCQRTAAELLDGDVASTFPPAQRCVCPAYSMDTVNGAVVITDTEDRWTVEAMTARAQAEVVAMVKDGWRNSKGDLLLPTVESFSRLHDYCDANTLGGLCDDDSPNSSWEENDPSDVVAAAEAATDRANAMQDAVDRWLKSGGLLDALDAVVVYARLVFVPGRSGDRIWPGHEALDHGDVVESLEARLEEVYIDNFPSTPFVEIIDGPLS